MTRERALKIAMVLVGLAFVALIYPITSILWSRDQAGYTDAMMGSIYFALGIFLLLGARNPTANRSLIGFTIWSSFAHAAVMTVMAVRDPHAREFLLGVAIFASVGLVLLVLAPSKTSVAGT
jgi:Na+/H+ antiporter NhaA